MKACGSGSAGRERSRSRIRAATCTPTLVYLYGACDRGRSWRELARTGKVFDRFTGQVRTPKAAQLRLIVDLSIVNELDVIEHDPAVAARHGAYFRELFASWATLAGEQVILDAQRVLHRD